MPLDNATLHRMEDEQRELERDVDAALEQLEAAANLCDFWRNNSERVLEWARRLQKWPFSWFGFAKKFGEFVEKLVPLITNLCGDN